MSSNTLNRATHLIRVAMHFRGLHAPAPINRKKNTPAPPSGRRRNYTMTS